MTVVYFILILSLIIVIHELGHFLFARLFGIHVYEFSLGMGPKVYQKIGKDGIEYSIRAFPIGGFVRIAGEDDQEEDNKIEDDKKLTSKSWLQRFIVMGAGSMFNLFFAIIIIFALSLTMGSVSTKPIIGEAMKGYPAYEVGISEGDLILRINGEKVSSYDEMVITLYEIGNHPTLFEVKKADGKIVTYTISPKKEKENYVYGLMHTTTREYGLLTSITYTSNKFIALINTMSQSIMALISGHVTINQFSGPVGVYDMVGDQVAAGIGNIAYFIAYLSINIGFLNLLPIPALDGGKILFLIVEAIMRRPVNAKIENAIHYAGFMFLIVLMLVVTFNDLFKLGG